jgi:hypothetical protein
VDIKIYSEYNIDQLSLVNQQDLLMYCLLPTHRLKSANWKTNGQFSQQRYLFNCLSSMPRNVSTEPSHFHRPISYDIYDCHSNLLAVLEHWMLFCFEWDLEECIKRFTLLNLSYIASTYIKYIKMYPLSNYYTLTKFLKRDSPCKPEERGVYFWFSGQTKNYWRRIFLCI